jgi:hypothetical protein
MYSVVVGTFSRGGRTARDGLELADRGEPHVQDVAGA